MSKPYSGPRLKVIDILSRLSQTDEKYPFLKAKPSTTPSEKPSTESKTD
jgi:hypothetical protein